MANITARVDFLTVRWLVSLHRIHRVHHDTRRTVRRTQFNISTSIHFRPRRVLISFLHLVRLEITFAILILNQAQHIGGHHVSRHTLARRRAAITRVTISSLGGSTHRFVFFRRTARVRGHNFVKGPVRVRTHRLTRSHHFVRQFLRHQVTVTRPILRRVGTRRHRRQVNQAATFAF